VLSRLVDIRFQSLFTPLAGVLFTFPSRYWFTIGRQVVFSLGRWSSRIPTGFHESRSTQVSHQRHVHFAYRAITFFGGPSQALQLCSCLLTLSGRCRCPCMTLQPHTYNAGTLTYARFGLFRVRSPLLAESLLISFPEGTEMFHFPSFAAACLCIQRAAPSTFLDGGFPIRKSTDRRLLAAPRGLSQLTTSFFTSWRQGIHRMPLLA
jgi:hypothetical protein